MSFVARRLAAFSTAIILLVIGGNTHAQKEYDIGATDAEIKIGQTVPFSGPYSVYASIGKTEAAYLKMINDQGGINGRKITLIQYDDAYLPPKAVEQVRKLVEGDEVLFMFQLIGTATNAAVQKYLNSRKVPQLLTGTGASRFTDPKNYPWTLAFNPNFKSEARIYAEYILANHPDAKIAVLYQNDDVGRDYVAGLKGGLGEKANSMIVGEASYEIDDPTVDSQVVKLKSTGADLLFDASTPKFAAQTIRKLADIEWAPVHILEMNASAISATLKPAGLGLSKGIISTSYSKDPSDPQWKDDPGVKAYFFFMAKYYPDGDKLNTLNVNAYSAAELLVHILRQCGDNLTRENVMRQATSIKDYIPSLALPGTAVSTSGTDYRINKQMQMMRFNGERWELFGPIIEDTGPVR
ncbi:ABC-type branched-subunit amino acid transport system substrate-binding protein [Bradyrhizobium elkanii]|uniref:ABC transporter substrate-binding protein n=1 Tax=Bradyrhizobium elkanii TaxID=29448 RepID=UPI002227656F|nr:ABC transporter substrate-binding protein [Bradyrhizobium elkanii]MCW2124925.1 ABC-type branched-subunit amino acid transport system substrate-binding protein [Bradyrhizobium elkanii]MCW2171671.1 ABC-type branched-subunit amino acid transport system substrate-binding protein [Bradyrhizobium elkanii]